MSAVKTSSTYPELRRSGARIVADRLRAHILNQPEGAHLGSEDELAQQLETGRHTLRQAARLLEEQRLLKVKRGVGGGYYGVRSDMNAAADAAAAYLQTRAGSRADLFAAMNALHVELVRSAAISDLAEGRGWLATLRARLLEGLADEHAVEEFDFELRDCLFSLVRNPFLEFMLRIQVRYAFQAPDSPLVHLPERIAQYSKHHLQLIDAVLDRDPEIAMLAARRFSLLLRNWLAP
ncbi:FadR family transcriptional regulator [Sphingomonas sp. CL5.1]|uniref:FadR/GntR family transcriptional regulator n=1 Tax=Sphingomonas sp. CL5.1 TaxID=2653203 RepID=UPI0015822069|nr:GntR family transcriptional regulator [Sphingomonas sp. CL5.1]QKS00327.1 FadR family transcriptional regulator [Sphingomonas sp. CL5.1]